MKVRYIGDRYRSLHWGWVYDVIRVNRQGTLVLRNPAYGNESSYADRDQFEIIEENKLMLHIAFPLIDPSKPPAWDNIKVDQEWMEDVSVETLKSRIRADIAKNPDSKWIIFSANTIGETSQPPVRFRSI